LALSLRHRCEQYFTSSQFFAQALRQDIGRPHARQGLLGSADLFPRKDCFGSPISGFSTGKNLVSHRGKLVTHRTIARFHTGGSTIVM
jgi:hypothetical protein